jgi:hypothetical protein
VNLICSNEGRTKSINVVACQTCGEMDEPVRALRATRFTIFMCDDCALRPLTNDEGKEFRLTAVAMEAM